ncbi:hypothetical protein DdX_02998 [Ditylenchus destructor]|uniref:Uncharacterized protein n=1 Tax=Ditylenchus destructor TaxID=166010 RepID=A0AAD4R6I3_9BILA|nr:hypothetical protein DdX_02998 [Ditylenchus destructor]
MLFRAVKREMIFLVTYLKVVITMVIIGSSKDGDTKRVIKPLAMNAQSTVFGCFILFLGTVTTFVVYYFQKLRIEKRSAGNAQKRHTNWSSRVDSMSTAFSKNSYCLTSPTLKDCPSLPIVSTQKSFSTLSLLSMPYRVTSYLSVLTEDSPKLIYQCDCSCDGKGPLDDYEGLFMQDSRFECSLKRMKQYTFRKCECYNLVAVTDKDNLEGLSAEAVTLDEYHEDPFFSAFRSVLHSLVYASNHGKLLDRLAKNYSSNEN